METPKKMEVEESAPDIQQNEHSKLQPEDLQCDIPIPDEP